MAAAPLEMEGFGLMVSYNGHRFAVSKDGEVEFPFLTGAMVALGGSRAIADLRLEPGCPLNPEQLVTLGFLLAEVL